MHFSTRMLRTVNLGRRQKRNQEREAGDQLVKSPKVRINGTRLQGGINCHHKLLVHCHSDELPRQRRSQLTCQGRIRHRKAPATNQIAFRSSTSSERPDGWKSCQGRTAPRPHVNETIVGVAGPAPSVSERKLAFPPNTRVCATQNWKHWPTFANCSALRRIRNPAQPQSYFRQLNTGTPCRRTGRSVQCRYQRSCSPRWSSRHNRPFAVRAVALKSKTVVENSD